MKTTEKPPQRKVTFVKLRIENLKEDPKTDNQDKEIIKLTIKQAKTRCDDIIKEAEKRYYEDIKSIKEEAMRHYHESMIQAQKEYHNALEPIEKPAAELRNEVINQAKNQYLKIKKQIEESIMK